MNSKISASGTCKPDLILVHYAEIGLKGKNRTSFEDRLVKNIRAVVQGEVKKIHGRILIEPKNMKNALKSLSRVFGVANFSPAVSCKSEMAAIKRTAVKMMNGKKGTFKVDARRAYKEFPKTSVQINEMVGKEIENKYRLKVKLVRPKNVLHVEVLKNIALLYSAVFSGPGGLPVGTAGKVISLLSGGIDSPVSTWMMMKRGCEVILVHFYNEVAGGHGKVEKLARILSGWQPGIVLILVPFRELQNKIITKVPAAWRIILYRRLMLRIAQEFAEKEQAKALVTGNSLGQVSSQTLENISAIEDAVDMPVFSPLIGFDKQEIISLAKTIGTYELSIRPYQDCCSFMIARHPVTRAKTTQVREIEKTLKIRTDIMKTIDKTRWIKF